MKKMHYNHQKIKRIHKILKYGKNLEKKVYNNFVKKYSHLIKRYNRNRNSYCAKFPPLWVLTQHKPAPPEAQGCEKWYWIARETGFEIAKVYKKIGLYNKFNRKFFGMIRCIGINICFCKIKTKDELKKKKLTNERNCYRKGYLDQIRISYKSYEKGEEPKFNNKWISLEERNKYLKGLIKNIENI